MAAARGIVAGDRWPAWTGSVAAADDTARPVPPVDALDERQLVEACLAGRLEAFDVLVVRHQRRVYGLCYRFVGNHEDAADLTQDVFLRAYRGLRGFRGGSSVSTWLYRIAVNVSLNRLSARSPVMQSIEVAQPLVDDLADPSAPLMKRETAGRVRAAVARLPKKQRATLILRVYQELSHQEIAAVLGTSVGAVKANFFHALTNLRRLLAGSERDETPVDR
jgi:RNA polymerase sigma-70 factor (ECF subfamily)